MQTAQIKAWADSNLQVTAWSVLIQPWNFHASFKLAKIKTTQDSLYARTEARLLRGSAAWIRREQEPLSFP